MNRTAQTLIDPQIAGVTGAAPVRDASGFRIFAAGETGGAHALAHRLLDTGRLELGHRLLGEWLEGRTGAGSDWVHLHFHMAIFELAVGDWQAAHARFQAEVLPAAASSEDALTDAPALLWRIAMVAPTKAALPWQPLRRTALRAMPVTVDPFVQLHNLLALAGAGDAGSIGRWLDARPGFGASARERLVERMAVGLQAIATREFGQARDVIAELVPAIARVGGSRAQNQLFEQMATWCARQSRGTTAVYQQFSNEVEKTRHITGANPRSISIHRHHGNNH